MFHLSETSNKNPRYFILLAVIILGVVSVLGTGGDGDGGVGTPPVITSVSPAQSSDSALVTTLVAAQFRIDMDGASINDTSFTLVDNAMTPVLASSISYDAVSRIATFMPPADLESGVEYIATLTTAIQDSAGNNPLSTNYVWSFQIAPTLVLVSLDSNGVSGNSPSSTPAIDQTGRYVVFESTNNLVPGLNTGGIAQIYRKDTLTGEVRVVSTDNNGLTAADGNCSSPKISDNGRYVVFDSPATILDTNIASGGIRQVYLKDMQTGAITLLSQANATTGGNGASSGPDISADGRYIVFESLATNLVTGDGNGISDVFFIDMLTAPVTVERVSVDTEGLDPDGSSHAPVGNANGRYVAFQSAATDLIATDTNGVTDIFLRDRQTSATERVSVSTLGTQVGLASTAPSISADGRYVAFESAADLLDGSDTNSVTDIYLRDRLTPATTRVSVATDGIQANGVSTAPAISADGRYIVFQSNAADLIGIGNDTNGVTDVFLHDTQTTTTTRVSVATDGTEANGASTDATVSSDGRYVGFSSLATLDSVNDTNGVGVRDIYRVHRTHQ